MMEEEVIPDPAEDDPSLSAQVGEETFCAGPVMFPMAEGADADRWAQEFGYPLEFSDREYLPWRADGRSQGKR